MKSGHSELWRSKGAWKPKNPKGYKRKSKIDEDSPKIESARRKFGWKEGGCDINRNYLSRFLQKNVGRPWDKVYSEICKASSGYTKHEILYQIDFYVEFNCEKINGKVYDFRGLRVYGRRQYYVDQYGILRKA